MAGLYRQLRHGLEQARNAPAAADLYYGEMEMRRRAPVNSRGQGYSEAQARTRAKLKGRAEKAILHAYWFFSGYGLRAWRPLLVVGSLIVPASADLSAVCRVGYDDAVVDVARWSVSLMSNTDAACARTGVDLLVIPVRVLAPVLIALTILAIRSRVHR